MKKECRFCGGDLSVAEHLDQNHKWGNCIESELNSALEEIQTADSFRSAQLATDILDLTEKLNPIPDAHEQATLTYAKAADAVIDVLTDFGFLTETPFDETELKIKIMSAIQKNIEGNTTYGRTIR